LWVRLVDVPVALAQRRYAAPGAVVLEVTDAVCDWNTGRYLLDATGAVAGCERTDRAPELELSVTELGAAFLGGTRLGSLAAAGRVVEHVPGALARADAMFAWSPLPACPEVF
ncbi:MAG TPA: sterol carrier protein domain-containing protein, partial [Mycobacteriales bacterium]|nr:sterol carrier protein domain-containing protein [Mycobacteriales bacterium]